MTVFKTKKLFQKHNTKYINKMDNMNVFNFQEDDEWKDVEEDKPNEEEDPKKKYEGLRVGMKSLVYFFYF